MPFTVDGAGTGHRRHALIMVLVLFPAAGQALGGGSDDSDGAPGARRQRVDGAESSAAWKSPYARWKNGPPRDPSFFPIAVWLQNPKNAARYREAGINLYVGLWKGPTEEQLRGLRAADMHVICHQNEVGLAHRDDPTIVGWMQDDEPDNAQVTAVDPETGKKTYGGPVPPQEVVEHYEDLREADPTRPVFLNLGQGVANDEWKGRGRGARPDDYLTYVKGCDIVSFDVYPVAGLRKPDGENYLWYVAKGVDRLVRWTRGKRVVWNCIECTRISSGRKKATPEQVRAEVWMSLIHGSTGITYFVHEFTPRFNEDALLDDPEMLTAVTAINREIHELAPVLNSPTVEGLVSVKATRRDAGSPEGGGPDGPPGLIDLMAKRHGGALWIFAVGMRNSGASGVFHLRGTERTAAEVIGEDRKLEIRDGRFEDEFMPYAVHIYRTRSRRDAGP